MKQRPRFKIVYLEEAITFLVSLPEKVQDKIAYNIGKCMYYNDNELFKKLGDTDIWEFRTLYNGILIAFLPFGIKMKRRLSLPHTVL